MTLNKLRSKQKQTKHTNTETQQKNPKDTNSTTAVKDLKKLIPENCVEHGWSNPLSQGSHSLLKSMTEGA